MTHLEHIEIEGFKGLESLSFEPTGVNVITGRNNTGKTSLLEAIELGLEPHTLETFGEHVDTLVHVEHDQATIGVESAEHTQTITLNQPSEERTREILVEAEVLHVSEFVERMVEITDLDQKILDVVDNQLRAIVADVLTSEITEQAGSEIIVLTINDAEFPFIVPDETVSKLHRDIIEEVYERAYNRGVPDEYWERASKDLAASQFGYRWRPFFMGDSPLPGNVVTTIDSFDLADPPETENGEADAVKIDDIEEFLTEKEIVDDLRSFDLDYLVFEDDQQGKYSVPYEFMGDGFKAIVGLLWTLLDSDSEHNIVLLEEPGSHMHPGYIRELVYFLVGLARTEDIQLFVTTHNNDFISDFFGENLTDEERAFLEEEFTLVQLQDDAADVMSYTEAEEQLTELHLDLRGL